MSDRGGPFEVLGEGGPPGRARPPPLAWLQFVVRRVVLIGLTGLLTALLLLAVADFSSSLRLGLAALPLSLGAMAAWLPSTAVILHARFLGVGQDDRAVLVNTGEVLDRRSMLALAWARTADFGLACVFLLLVASSFALLSTAVAALLLAVLVPFVALVLLFVLRQQASVRATVAFFGGDYNKAQRAARFAQGWPATPRNLPLATVIGGQIALRLEGPQAATALLLQVPGPERFNTDILLAGLQLGQGQPAPAQALVRSPSPQFTRQLALDTLAALLDLQQGRPQAILAREPAWDGLRDALPHAPRSSRDLLLAAAYQGTGDPKTARHMLARSGVDLADRAWMEAAWPWYWALLHEAARPE